MIKSGVFFFLSGMLFQVASADPTTVSCSFPNQTGQMVLEHCAQKTAKGAFTILKPALDKIKFDSKGLAGGSISKQGCYWLNKKGFMQKTHCFDNGADPFKENLARFVDDSGKLGYMDQNLEIKIPAKYTFAFPFESGYAKVCMGCTEEKAKDSEHSSFVGGKWAVINKTGRIAKKCLGANKEHECSMPAAGFETRPRR